MLLLFSTSCPRSGTGRFLWHMMNIQFDENVKPIQIEVTSDFLRARKGLYIKQASACQPPTREICCIGPGVVDS